MMVDVFGFLATHANESAVTEALNSMKTEEDRDFIKIFVYEAVQVTYHF